MNPQIREIYSRSEGRFMNDVECAQLLSYAEGLSARLETMQAVQRAEAAIVEDAVALSMANFKQMKDENGPMAPHLAKRDFTMFLRYAAASHVLVSPNFIYDKLVVWYRTIIFALVRPEMVVMGFKKLIESCNKHLSADDARAITPYLELVVTELESNLKKEAA